MTIRRAVAEPMSEEEMRAQIAAYLPWMQRAAWKLPFSKDQDKVDEIVSEAVILAIRRRTNFDAEKGGIARWLYWNIRSVATADLKARKKRNREVAWPTVGEDGDETPYEVPVEPEQDHVLALKQVLAAMEHLSERDRRVLLGRADGLTLADLAGEMGCTNEWIRQIEVAARKRLKRILARRPTLDNPNPVHLQQKRIGKEMAPKKTRGRARKHPTPPRSFSETFQPASLAQKTTP